MRGLNRRACIAAAAVVLVFNCGTSHAAKAAHKPGASKSGSAEVQSLRQAYSLLETADHDYKGHRARAMRLIEAACKSLGSSAKGDGQGDEPQSQSDSQLQQALSLLQGVQGNVSGSNARAAKHVEQAIKELKTALSID